MSQQSNGLGLWYALSFYLKQVKYGQEIFFWRQDTFWEGKKKSFSIKFYLYINCATGIFLSENMKNHFWKATKSSASLLPLLHTLRIASTCVLTLTTVQCMTLCPMEYSCSINPVIQLTIIVHVPPPFKNIWISANGGCKNAWLWKEDQSTNTMYFKLKAWSVYSIINIIIDKVC